MSVRLGVIADIHGNDVALRAVLADAGRFGVESWWVLDGLPAQLRLRLPGGDAVLGVHASPRADDGQGIEPGIADDELGPLVAGAGAEVVIGGHTHAATDRAVGGVRALNPGSTGLPRRSGIASWLLLEDDGDGLAVTIREVPFDVEAVVADLRRRRHPQTEFVTSVLTGRLGGRTRAGAASATTGCGACGGWRSGGAGCAGCHGRGS